MTERGESIVLGGGCFWCMEAVFDRLKGVLEVTPGYSGGHDPAPDYRRVCRGETGHADVVLIIFDPEHLSLRQVLEVFFVVHDPTTPNRQGADVGTQYRSIILPRDETQELVARAVIREVEEGSAWGAPVVTEVTSLERFFPAEAAHHEYYHRNPDQPYCQLVIAPKLARARGKVAHLFSD